MLRNFWYACEFSHVVTDQPKQIELWNQKIVLYRDLDGNVIAVKDRCPHRGAALSLGKVKNGCIECPYHGWQFSSDGKCTKIPSNPPHVAISAKASVERYAVKEKYGFVWLFWGDLPVEECPPLPTFPDLSKSSMQPVYVDVTIKAHYSRVLENIVDPVHPTFVHGNSVSSSVNNVSEAVQKNELSLEPWGGRFLSITEQPKSKRVFFWNYFLDQGQRETKTEMAFHLPNFIHQRIDFQFSFIGYFCLLPVDETTTIVKVVHCRSFLRHPWVNTFFQKLIVKILEEDKPILESQQPKKVPDDLKAELHAAGDSLSIAYRKLRRKCLSLGRRSGAAGRLQLTKATLSR